MRCHSTAPLGGETGYYRCILEAGHHEEHAGIPEALCGEWNDAHTSFCSWGKGCNDSNGGHHFTSGINGRDVKRWPLTQSDQQALVLGELVSVLQEIRDLLRRNPGAILGVTP